MYLRSRSSPPSPGVRIGVLSAASIASKNASAITASGNTVAAIGSRSLAKAAAWAARHAPGAAAYGSYEDLLHDSTLDALYIPLPCALHAEWVIVAAATGRGVLVEKPAARSLGELEAMVQACAHASVPFLDGCMFFFHERLPLIKAALTAPSFGAPVRVSTAFSFCGDAAFQAGNIRMDPELEPLGCLGDLGLYCIYFGLWAYDFELPVSVTAHAHSRNAQGVPQDTSCLFLFPPAPGQAAPRTLHMDNSFVQVFRQWAEVSSQAAVLRLEDFVIADSHAQCQFVVTQNPGLDASHCSVVHEARTVTVVKGCNQEKEMWTAFAAAVREKRFVPEWAERAVKVQACLDAAFESMRLDGARVLIPRPGILNTAPFVVSA